MSAEKFSYNPHIIEPKWQKIWSAGNLSEASDFSKKPKKYILAEFPYPSGLGLHVGNIWGYTVGDVLARFYRMSGENVLFPMGWDSFGLPTENYAIKTGRPPQETVAENIKTFKEQMLSLGLSFDFRREIDTSAPNYYKWTQWIFLQMFKKGLAYKAKIAINWCPKCKTGLANEEVLSDGTHERCGAKVGQRELEQWLLRITKYGERLSADLDKLNWPKHIKDMQKNWIGKSEGASIKFKVQSSKFKSNSKLKIKNENEEYITVFTTRPDTIFGATYLVLSPEHPQIEALTVKEREAEVKKHVKKSLAKTEIERTSADKEKTGVFLGAYANNPVNGEKIPIWVADYVVGSYGGGAIMAVPAHDARDWEFAKKYGLPVKKVIVPSYKDPKFQSAGWRTNSNGVFEGYGTLVNSGDFTGMTSEKAIFAICKWLEEKACGKYAVNFKMRDWVFSRQHYWGEPIPMVYCETCAKKGEAFSKEIDWDARGWFPLDEALLPLQLPVVKDYKLSEDGRSSLSKALDWVKTTCPNCGALAKRETDTMPNWAGSNWYYLRFLDPKNEKELVSKGLYKYYMPVDLYLGGPEHTTLHLLYSRFIHKFLYDIGVVGTDEPYTLRINRGMILGEDGRKMSKSFGNVINPNELVEKIGADSVRMYELFLGPINGTYVWSTVSILGLKRFLDKVWQIGQGEFSKDNEDVSARFKKTVYKVTEDIKKLKFHTAIAFMMEYVNSMSKSNILSAVEYKEFLKLLAPFAPFITEELWHTLGGEGSVHKQQWPKYNLALIKEDKISISVQVNGKFKGLIELSADKAGDRGVVEKMAGEIEKVRDMLFNKEIKRVIFVPNKTINFVV
ncbi:MAG: leucine--tRNA ligase [Patescibacteria group bacterium]|nr:leucine--tRNA ligase [Patescibacteria group bacterium]